ncbi:hypothetical protein [Bradyrhizobium diazoefficiens]|uniref:hypothetical protein n=1 Tax=Bradyrhizobium diazoefficiens TaxID=1355477 RepID=UPI00272C8D69|nr:hypothetical protein [Bradyrhizobium diazoefficiens]WLA57482.1 hypothetical protein QIH81_01675 [Bradyrhizobium diazoefficiens]
MFESGVGVDAVAADRGPDRHLAAWDMSAIFAILPRIRNQLMSNVNTTQKSPHDRLETYEKWSAGATLGILIGIIIEIIVLSYYDYHPDRKFWSSIAANVLIGLGLLIEFFCIRWTIIASSEAEDENRGKLAAALDRASAAEQELIEFRKTRRHVIGPNKTQLADRLRPFAGTEFDTAMSHFEREIGDILWDIEDALHVAGWRQIDWSPLPGASAIQRTSRPLAGSALAQNVEIELHPGHHAALKPVAEALIEGLKSVGIDAGEVPYTSATGNHHAIHVLVGPKR